jgi:hypothetical protein
MASGVQTVVVTRAGHTRTTHRLRHVGVSERGNNYGEDQSRMHRDSCPIAVGVDRRFAGAANLAAGVIDREFHCAGESHFSTPAA